MFNVCFICSFCRLSRFFFIFNLPILIVRLFTFECDASQCHGAELVMHARLNALYLSFDVNADKRSISSLKLLLVVVPLKC